jgi:hypothetical protein
MVPVAEFRWDRAPFGAVVEPPNDGLDRAPVVFAPTRPTQLDRRHRCFELGLLIIGQDLHCLSSAIPAESRASGRFAKC